MLEQPDASLLLKAAAAGDLDEVRKQLGEGVPIDATDVRRRTPVLLAAMNGHHDVVRHLVAAGADIDKQDETSFNVFLYGCISNDIELVRIALDAGADLELLTRFGGNGLTPAAEKGHLDIVRELLTTTDINVNLTNGVGWTALIEAIILGDGGPTQQEVVSLLLAHGASPHLTDKWGATPLDLARGKGYAAIAELLVRAGA